MIDRLALTVAIATLVCSMANGDSVVELHNQCADDFDLVHVDQRTITVDRLVVGSIITQTIRNGSPSHVFKSGTGAQATLAEFSMVGGQAWFDISVIPTGPRHGPDYCASLEACKNYTGGVGFNVAMQIIPESDSGPTCHTLTCMREDCVDGYLYPKDDTKTHSCAQNTNFKVIFCPGETTQDDHNHTTEDHNHTTNEDTMSNSSYGSNLRQTSASGSADDAKVKETNVTVPTSTPMPAMQQEVIVANTQSSKKTSTGVEVYILSILGCVAMTAGVVIIIMNRKKRHMEKLDVKSPVTDRNTRTLLS